VNLPSRATRLANWKAVDKIVELKAKICKGASAKEAYDIAPEIRLIPYRKRVEWKYSLRVCAEYRF
jgi:hypothetical protein